MNFRRKQPVPRVTVIDPSERSVEEIEAHHQRWQRESTARLTALAAKEAAQVETVTTHEHTIKADTYAQMFGGRLARLPDGRYEDTVPVQGSVEEALAGRKLQPAGQVEESFLDRDRREKLEYQQAQRAEEEAAKAASLLARFDEIEKRKSA